MSKKFMYGIGAVCFKGKDVGYIEKNSFDLGGKKPEAAEIEAEQSPGAAVLIIPQSNGTIEPTFNAIELVYENLKALLGGKLHKKQKDGKEVVTGWTAPSTVLVLSGPFELRLVSGQSVLLPNATLLCNLGGKLTLTETAKVECQLKLAAPEEKGIPPYGIFDSDDLPDEWGEDKFSLPKESAGTD